jgi:hypothetical protein
LLIKIAVLTKQEGLSIKDKLCVKIPSDIYLKHNFSTFLIDF